jgi:hypothetical protein
MKPIPIFILCMLVLAVACEKQTLDPSLTLNSSTVSDAKKQQLTIKFVTPSISHLDDPNVYFYSNGLPLDSSGGNALNGGNRVSDSCEYISLKRSSGTVGILGFIAKPQWSISIEERRSKATLIIGEPYYWIQYIDDPTPRAFRFWETDLDKINWPYIKIGPFRDTTSRGTGIWNITSSSHPLINKGYGKLVYTDYIKYDFSDIYYQHGDGDGQLSDIHRRSYEESTLTGIYR